MQPTRIDSWFPYNNEPVYEKTLQPKPERLSRGPYPAQAGTSSVSPAGPSPLGMTGSSVSDPTWTASAPGGELMEGMPQSSDFPGWEYGGNPLTMVPDLVRSSLMSKMNGITRSYF